MSLAPHSDYLVVLAGVEGGADVESVVQRDLVTVRHQLIERAVVEGGGEVAQQAGQALAGVHDVPVRPQHDDEPVHRLQHEVSELLRGEKLRLPVGLNLVSLENNILFISESYFYSWETTNMH